MAINKKGKLKASAVKRDDKKKVTSSQRKAQKAQKAEAATATAPKRPPKKAKPQLRPEEYAYDLDAASSVKVSKNRSLRDVMKLKGRTRAEADRLEERTKPPPRPPSASPMPSFKIIAGSYEKLLYGLEATFDASSPPSPNPVPSLKPIFIFPAHIGCVRCVASSQGNEVSSGKWLATGSTADEIVKIWDLRKRKEIGGLLQHQGSITYLTFPSPSHLLTCSEDGTICLFRSRDWVLLRVFKGHKGRVNAVAVHPSGKLALSVGRDKTIRMWDFMRGKPAGSTKIYKEAELVLWSTSGKFFATQTLNSIEIFSTSMTILHQITHTSRIQDLRFVSLGGREVLLVAGEDKRIAIYEDPSERTNHPAEKGQDQEVIPGSEYRIVRELVGHQNRVKAVATLAVTFFDRSVTSYVSSISSDGRIHLYDLSAGLNSKDFSVQPIASYDSKGSRLTSLTMAMGNSPFSQKIKQGQSEDDEAGDGSDEMEGGSQGLEDSDSMQGEMDEEGDDEDWDGIDEEESSL